MTENLQGSSLTEQTNSGRLPQIEVYSDLHCPWAYLAVFRLRQLWPDYAEKLEIQWRSLSLEYINRRGTPKTILDLEFDVMKQIEPDLPVKPWSRPDSEWPVTIWPAFEALECAQAQGSQPAFELSWELRRAFFEDSHSLSLRSEIFNMVRKIAGESGLDQDRLEADWDSGRYKQNVIRDSQRGWHELKVKNSPTFVLPDGQQFANPAAGELKLDLKTHAVISYTPPEENWVTVYRSFLDAAANSQPYTTAEVPTATSLD
jgi:predicted DsbA family dithiol-disulfide isomerase